MHIQVSLIVDLDASVSLSSMEAQIQEAGHQAMRLALRQGVHQWEQEHRMCPHCASQHVRLEGTVARTVQALFGKVRVPRQRLRCQQCHRRFCPAKALLAPLQAGRVSPALCEAACLAGASWPYQQAAQTLSRFSGAQISAEEIRLLTNRSGRQLARAQLQQAQTCSADPHQGQDVVPEASRPQERTIIGLDGGWIPNRERRGGMEGKVAVLVRGKEVFREPKQPSGELTWVQLEQYLRRHRHPQVQRCRYHSHRYAATFAHAKDLGLLAAAAAQQVERRASEQVVVTDGAHWIKTQTHLHFPGATCILDWPHLWRTVSKAVREVAQQREASSRWAKHQAHQLSQWLWKGDVQRASALLLQWQQEQQGHPPLKALKAAITYLDQQREWIGDYEQWKKQGYPVGSGLIERAVALVINRRMKRQGMSWLRPNATSVVALRVAVLNDEWPFPFPTHSSA